MKATYHVFKNSSADQNADWSECWAAGRFLLVKPNSPPLQSSDAGAFQTHYPKYVQQVRAAIVSAEVEPAGG